MKKRWMIVAGVWLAGAVFIGSGGAGKLFSSDSERILVVHAAKNQSSKEIQQQINEVNQERKSAEEEKKNLEAEIAALETKKDNILEYIEALDQKLSELGEKISQNETNISNTKAEIKVLRAQKKEAEATKKSQYDTMTRRIKYMYENGSEGYLEILLESGSLAELFNRMEYVNKVTSYDNTMLLKYQETCDAIQKAQKELDSKLAELEELKKSLEVEKDSVDLLMDKKTEQLANYEAVISEKNEAVETTENLIRQQEDELEDLLEAKRKQIEREEQERKKKEEAEKKQNASDNSPSDSSTTQVSGDYCWPLTTAGRISSYFGYRTAPTAGASTFHKGIDVAIPTGTGILATRSGTVVTSTYSASAGYYVALSHGDGVYSYYMHCSKLLVSEGQQVSKGQQIALSGNTGISTGPHLHFAIYVNGAYVDPLKYVSQ